MTFGIAEPPTRGLIITRIRRLLHLVLLLAIPAAARTDLSSFDTVLHIMNNGSVVVVEHLAMAKPVSHIIWNTALEYPGKWSIHRPRIVDIYQVTTGDGRPLSYSARRRGDHLELDIDTAGVTEVRLVYNIGNAVEFSPDHDRLLWQPGEGWLGSAKAATVFVQVPPEIASGFQAQAYLGGHGLVPTQESSDTRDRVWFSVPGLSPADRLIVDAVLAPGVVQQRSAPQRAVWFISANTVVLLPFLVLIVMLTLKRIKSLPEEDDSSIVARYDPPAGLSPAEVGVLVDDSLDPRDITATIIDLAIRRYVRLEHGTPDEDVAFDGQDFIIRLLRPIEEWKDLKPHEQTVLFHTFYGGTWTKLSSLTFRFYSVVPALRVQIGSRLRLQGFYWMNPQKVHSLRLLNFGVLALILYIVQLTGVTSFSDSWLLSLISTAVSLYIVHRFGRRLTAKTRKGLRVYREIVGLREFLNSVDHDRLERLPADLFERCLPYAIALGVEHHWANAFSGVALGPPEWFATDPVLFNTVRLARVIDLFSRPKAENLPVQRRGAVAKT